MLLRYTEQFVILWQLGLRALCENTKVSLSLVFWTHNHLNQDQVQFWSENVRKTIAIIIIIISPTGIFYSSIQTKDNLARTVQVC